MKVQLDAILAHLNALRRREQGLVLGRLLSAGLAGALAVWTGAMLAAWWGVERADAVAAVAGVAVLTGLGLLGWAALRLRTAAGLTRQARLSEAAEPRLRGRMITVLERLDGPRPSESPALLALAASKAARLSEGVEAAAVHSAAALRKTLAVASSLALVWGCLGLVAPMGPFATLGWLTDGTSPAGAAPPAGAIPVASESVALVGELVLRYQYPDYTGLEPLEVPNSNGTAHGPPGTRVTVRARTAERWDSARLEAYDDDPAPATLEDGRDLRGSFVITEPGRYRFLLRRGAVQEPSPDYRVEVEPDLPPVVELDSASDRLEVGLEELIPLGFKVRDDYGVSRVTVEMDGRIGAELRRPLTAERELRGFLDRSPRDLGLSPGDEVKLVVAGWDNDAVSGSKAGRSRTVRLVVLGPKAQSLRFERLRRELRDALVDVLAGFVTDPDPLPERQAALSAWGVDAAGRFKAVDDLVDAHWDVLDDRSLEGRVIQELRRQATAMLSFVQGVADPRGEDAVDPVDLDAVAEMHEELVETLEIDVLMLDLMVRYRALKELYARSEALAADAERLSQEAMDDAPPTRVLSRLDDLEELADAMEAAAEAYDSAGLSELVSSWLGDAERIGERARDAFAEGDRDQANARLDELADQLARLAATLRSMAQQMEEATEEDRQAIEDFIEELQRLEAEERGLLARTQEARRSDGGSLEDLVASWEQAARLSGEIAELTEEVGEALASERGRYPRERGAAERAAVLSARMNRSVLSRDMTDARDEVARSGLAIRDLQDSLTFYQQRLDTDPSLNAPHQARLLRAANAARNLDAVLRQIDRIANRASPELTREAEGFAEVQGQLLEDTSATLPTARQLAEGLPMGAPGLVESLEGAEREMTRAEMALRQARAVEAEGAEEAAADRIRQALEALSQSAAAMQQLQEGMEGGGQPQEGEGGGGGDQEEGPLSDGRIELPDPEQFRTPEEYRQALLEGMQGEVPPEYEALKRRYYEELVRQ